MSHGWFRLAWLLAGIVTYALAGPAPASAALQAGVTAQSTQDRLKSVGNDLLAGRVRPDAAVQELKNILAIDPRSADAHLLLAIAYRLLGSQEFADEAVAELQQALASNADLLPARIYLAQAYSDMGRLERSREELEEALLQVPGNAQVLAMLGNVHRQLKNPGRAQELIRQALEADPAFGQARYYLALTLLDDGQRDRAIRELEQVIQSHPDTADVYVALGAAYLDANRVREAIATLNEGTRIEPARPELQLQLARAYRLDGRFDRAEEHLALARPANAGSLFASQQAELDLYLERSALSRQEGHLAAATDALEKALTIEPDFGPAHRDLADVYLLRRLFRQSQEHAARAAELGFPLPEARRKLIQQGLDGARPRSRQ